MILAKEQIERYLRHVIMPEISGKGQKKLLESTIYLYGENTDEIMPMVLYLSAIGIGKIYCCLKDDAGYESLFCKAVDLNNDVSIDIANNNIPLENADVRILFGSMDFVKTNIESNLFVPTIVSVTNGWMGTLQTFTHVDSINSFLSFINSGQCLSKKNPLLTSFSGALCTVECVKLLLSIGTFHENLLLFDLLLMEFSIFDENNYEQAINKINNQNDNQASIDEILQNLKNSKVLIVGCGGLGSPVALSLAIAGVGTIGLLDLDKVELSNLNRQILHSVSRIGMPKAESAKQFLCSIKNNINVISHDIELTKDNSEKIIKEYDVVVSAVDNIQTRYIINDACYLLKKPLVESGVLKFDGTNTTIIPDEGHCYRCLYPNVNTSGMSCQEAGVLGSVPGAMGFIEAIEVVKVLLNIGVTLKNKILLFDGLDMEFNVISIKKNPQCPTCGLK